MHVANIRALAKGGKGDGWMTYTHHPRFAGVEQLYAARLEHLEGGDVLVDVQTPY